MTIAQIIKPGRKRPYITLVDTGLALAAQNLLAGIILYHGEGDLDLDAWMDRIEEVANALAMEIETRTF